MYCLLDSWQSSGRFLNPALKTAPVIYVIVFKGPTSTDLEV